MKERHAKNVGLSFDHINNVVKYEHVMSHNQINAPSSYHTVELNKV